MALRERGPKLGLDSIWQWMKNEREQLTYVWRVSATNVKVIYPGTPCLLKDSGSKSRFKYRDLYNSRKGSKASAEVIQQCL